MRLFLALLLILPACGKKINSVTPPAPTTPPTTPPVVEKSFETKGKSITVIGETIDGCKKPIKLEVLEAVSRTGIAILER
jgi:hypothetical protein